MSDGLIRRKWLRTAIIKMFGDSDIASSIDAIIDNAPTVNLEKHSFIEGYKEGCEYGKKCYARPQGELAEKLKDRIEESVCKYCQMNKHCELCEISRVFSIIALTDKDMKGGAEND